MNGPHPDLAERYLELVIRLLPVARRDWGDALRAELGAIDEAAERRRFALGCTRVALVAPGSARTLRQVVLAALVLAVVVGWESVSGSALGQMLPLALFLVLLAWLGHRPGAFGPAPGSRGARAVRLGGFGLIGLCLLTNGAPHLLGTSHWSPVFAVLLVAYAGAFLAVTASSRGLDGRDAASAAAAGIAAGVALFAVMHFERGGQPLAAHLPAGGTWLPFVVIGAPAAAALQSAWRTGRTGHALMAALCAGAIATLSTALLGFGAIVLFPGSLPDIAGHAMLPGTTASARQAENAIEAGDPYAGVMLLGGLLALCLWSLARLVVDEQRASDPTGVAVPG